MSGPIDFATVQWARQMTTAIQNLAAFKPADLRRLSNFLDRLADFRENEGELSEQQLQVILQNLHTKELARLENHKGGAYVEFHGGGFEYERFLVRADGKVPNNRYEAKKLQE
jgi:hypothetical protein